jgi:CubicO group peptidase (beta-lactamase class C family)
MKPRLKKLLGVLAAAIAVAGGSALLFKSPQLQAVTLSECAAPRQFNDGFAVTSPDGAGINGAKLCELIRQTAGANLNLHSLVVEKGGAIVAEQYLPGVDRSIWSVRGYVQDFGPDDQHDMRSVSKSVVGLLVGIAIAQGTITGVDTPIFDLYPGLVEYAMPQKRAITLRHVLSMSTGLAWDESVATYGTFANDETRLFWDWRIPRAVLKRQLVAEPGAQYNYNGGNTALLADLLEQKTGEPLADFARKYLFEPLGIRVWTWVRDPWLRHLSFAGLRLRPRDMLKIGRVVREGGVWQGKQIIPADWVAQSMRVHVNTADGLGYGYQWYSGSVAHQSGTIAWHGAMGNGGQRLFIVPKLDMTIAMTAGDYNSPTAGRAEMALFRSIVAMTPK